MQDVARKLADATAATRARVDAWALEGPAATELFLTIAPAPGAPMAQQAQDVFAAVRHCLDQSKAHIAQERIFADEAHHDLLRRCRQEAYGELNDGVAPTWLTVSNTDGQFPGVQLHAVRATQAPRPLGADGSARGRTLDSDGRRWVWLSGLRAPQAGDNPAQTRAVFEEVEAQMQQAGGTMFSVARTWIWLNDILSWYGPFNKARNRFFVERRIIAEGEPDRLPASTGIGVAPAGKAGIAMDAVGLIGCGVQIERLGAAGKQRSAYEYGSAFSRAARIATPAGQTVYVSGTAAIDSTGATRYINDIRGQIGMTIDNILAVLGQLQCQPESVVQALAYCATPEVERAYRAAWAKELGWPCLFMVADVCRSDLLFEVEVAACPGARKIV